MPVRNPEPLEILLHAEPVSVDDCQRKLRVNGEVAEPVTVKVSVSPAVNVSKFGPEKIGFAAVIQRMTTMPEPPLPPPREELDAEPAPSPPLPVSAVPAPPPLAVNVRAPFPPTPKVVASENEVATIPLPPSPTEEACPSVPSELAPPPRRRAGPVELAPAFDPAAGPPVDVDALLGALVGGGGGKRRRE